MRLAMYGCLIAVTVTTPHAQSQPGPIRATTAGVMIDVTVIDRKGQPVLDLTQNDFEVTEDGIRQTVLSATLVQNGATTALIQQKSTPNRVNVEIGGTASPATSSDSFPRMESTPTLTAILFDKLSPDAMPYASRAAVAYVSSLVGPNDYAGVFLVDFNLLTFQGFTTDQRQLLHALERIGKTAVINARPETRSAGDLAIQQLDPNTPPTASAESPGGFASIAQRERALASMDVVQRKMAEVVWRMEVGFRQLLAEYEGQASVAALRGLVDALAFVPGRKSVVYFCENLPLTDRIAPKFEALVGQANRGNVTFYPIDAAGLRLHSTEAEVSRNVNLAGSQGIGDTARPEGPWTKELERQNQLLASRSSLVLGRLAKSTGGFVIENTNDLATGVTRTQQERTVYYLIGYQPTNAAMDGTFRRVSVKVKRSKVNIRARNGYLAVAIPGQ